jgi:hypothetical protein
MPKNVRVFVEGTQRGFAVGIKRKLRGGREVIVKEEYHHDDGTTASIDRAYKAASLAAASLNSTLKRNPALLRRQGWL